MSVAGDHVDPPPGARLQVARDAVVVHDLVVRYGEVVAVGGASFSVRAGEVFGLLGPNGAGKTSVMRVLTTLRRADGGVAWVLGHEAGRHPGTVRRLIGYVPQELSADGSLTGRENVLLFAGLHRLPRAERRKRVDWILGLMGLGGVADQLARTYSGGMVRRLEIATALVHAPRVLLLDEPTVGLDPVARRAVWEHLHRLRAETGMTLVVTTHYMEEAEEHCDRVAVMSSGEVLAGGTLAQLRSASGRPDGRLEEIFVAVTGAALQEQQDEKGGLREVRRSRRTARRLG